MTAPENTRQRLAEALAEHAMCANTISRNIAGEYWADYACGSHVLIADSFAGAEHQHIADALLPLIDTLLREQLEGIAAAIEEAAPRLNFELRPDGTSEPATAAYVEGFHDAWSAVLASGGER